MFIPQCPIHTHIHKPNYCCFIVLWWLIDVVITYADIFQNRSTIISSDFLPDLIHHSWLICRDGAGGDDSVCPSRRVIPHHVKKKKKPEVVTHACIPVLTCRDRLSLRLTWPANVSKIASIRFSKGTLFQNLRWKVTKEDMWVSDISLWSPHTPAYICACMSAHTCVHMHS